MIDSDHALHLAALQDELRHVRQLLREAREDLDNLAHENRRLEQQLAGGDERRAMAETPIVLSLGRDEMLRQALFAGHVRMEADDDLF